MTRMSKLPPAPEPPKPKRLKDESLSFYFSDGSALILSEKGMLMVDAKAPYLVRGLTQTSSPAARDSSSDKK